MSFALDNVIPWGRSFGEYEEDLTRKILDCGFNAELTASGGHVLSLDPLYQYSVDAINQRIQEIY